MTREYLRVPRKAVHYFHGPERSPHANLKFLLGKFPRETWEQLPLNKRVCLGYCEWRAKGFSQDETIALYELMKKWRKEDKRIGKNRKVIERLFRAHVLTIVKKKRTADLTRKAAKKQHREGRSFLVEFNKRKGYLENLKLGPKVVALTGTTTKDWIIWSPEGEIYFVRNLYAFCKERGMDDSHLGKTSIYPGKFYKGFKAQKRVKTTDWWGVGGFD